MTLVWRHSRESFHATFLARGPEGPHPDRVNAVLPALRVRIRFVLGRFAGIGKK